MRKVTSGLFHSVDGVVSEPNLWQFDSFDEDMGKGLTGDDGTRGHRGARTGELPGMGGLLAHRLCR